MHLGREDARVQLVSICLQGPCRSMAFHTARDPWVTPAWAGDRLPGQRTLEIMLQRLYFWTPSLRVTKISQSSILKCLMHTFLFDAPSQDRLSGLIKNCTLAIGILGSWSGRLSFALVLVCSFLSHLRMNLNEPQPRPISICVWVFK